MNIADLVLERWGALDSTLISDALDSVGLPAGLGCLRPVWGAPRVLGRARTIEMEPDPVGTPGPHLATPVVAASRSGDVIVVANGGRLDVSCWGGLLSLGCAQRGIAGAIIDGACRDVSQAQQLGVPVYARGVCPRTARGRIRQRASGAPVRIQDVTVSEGDLVLADDSGVVFVPSGRAEEILAVAEAISRREVAISADIRSGIRIDHAMHDARLAGNLKGNP